jgi:hypothetical protein
VKNLNTKMHYKKDKGLEKGNMLLHSLIFNILMLIIKESNFLRVQGFKLRTFIC